MLFTLGHGPGPAMGGWCMGGVNILFTNLNYGE